MIKKLDIRPIISAMIKTVKRHELTDHPGAYCRWLWQNENKSRELGINEYGCADAVNILYTVNEFYCDDETRAARISALQSLQNKDTGMFTERTHHTIHTTAHCTAALELFEARPLYPIYGLHKYFDKNELYSLLDGLDWNDPWPQSHQGAGVYAALVNSGEITEDFQHNYFAWFAEDADPETGFWKAGYATNAPYADHSHPNGKSAPDTVFAYMAGGFHYFFNHEYAKMPVPYPDKIIDTCIAMYKNGGIRHNFGRKVDFLEVDWVYCMTRASRQTSHRNDEVRALIYEFSEGYVDYLLSLDYETHDDFNDLHMLFGCVCCLAELQQFMPGVIVTEKPLKLVLDRRPFI